MNISHEYEGEVADSIEYTVLKELSTNPVAKSWTDTSKWLPGTQNADFSTWYGITVENGDVTDIHLDNNNLTGAITNNLDLLR